MQNQTHYSTEQGCVCVCVFVYAESISTHFIYVYIYIFRIKVTIVLLILGRRLLYYAEFGKINNNKSIMQKLRVLLQCWHAHVKVGSVSYRQRPSRTDWWRILNKRLRGKRNCLSRQFNLSYVFNLSKRRVLIFLYLPCNAFNRWDYQIL